MSLISYVTRIHFAEGVLEPALEAELAALGIERPLVITDHGEDRTQTLQRLMAAVPGHARPAMQAVHAGQANEGQCLQATQRYHEHRCDALIAFGGAAAIDLAKAVGILISHNPPLRSYVGLEGGIARIRNTLPPLIAIPTTAGCGSELAGVAVLSTSEGPNVALVSPLLVPRIVVYDPTLTLDLSPERTASAGMDALTHCLETYISSAYNPPADGIALDGLRRVAVFLPRAVADGFNMEARREMMAAALNGALAHQKGLGGIHAMSHALCGISGNCSDHGAANAVLLPFVLEFNAPASSQRYADIRRELSLPVLQDLGDAFIRLRERIGLPSSLSELGIKAADIQRAAIFAVTDYANRTNPRKASEEDYYSMLSSAM